MNTTKDYELDALTLAFSSDKVDAAYRDAHPSSLLSYTRLGLVLAGLAVLVLSLSDAMLGESGSVAIRAALIAGTASVFAATFSRRGMLVLEWLLFLYVCLLGIGILATASSEHLLPAIAIVMLYACFSGLLFFNAFIANIVLTACYLVRISSGQGDPVEMIVIDFPVFFAAFIMAAFAGYAAERQRRLLFAQGLLLEEERSMHEKMARHDALTSLPNRNLLQERIEQSLARARRRHNQFAVLFIDLDNFKTVNDNYGHSVGDQVLITLARRLQAQVRTEDTVARLGGDEFVVISEQISSDQDVTIAANRLLEAIAVPVTLHVRESDTVTIKITASIGISLCPRDGDSLQALVDRADTAMYDAKKNLKGTFAFFTDKGLATQDPG